MWQATLRGVLAHKLRFVFTAFAVTVGVAFVVGTLVLTDSMDEAYQGVMADTAGGSDLVVRPVGASGVDADLLAVVEGVHGVAVADAVVLGTAQLVAADGTPVGQPVIGASVPLLGASAPPQEGLRGLQLRDGRFPGAGGEIAVDAAVAAAEGFAVGDRVGVVLDGPVEDFVLVGTVGVGSADAVPGATLTLFERATALDRLRDDGLAERIDVLAADRTDVDGLASRLREAVGHGFEVTTAAEVVEEEHARLTEGLAVVPVALLVFAFVALFVGSFTIFNTFAILVAQRTRELALLRAVGASRRQVLGSVLGEALLVGLAGGLAGLAAGVALAGGLLALLSAFGLDLPSATLRLGPLTATVGVVLGLMVTAAAAVVPALRATRVPPVAALSEAALAAPPAGGGKRTLAGALLAGLGIAAIAAGLAGAGVAAVGLGVLATMLGTTMLTALVAGALARFLGAPLAWFAGIRGELARLNAARSPRRTAATAAALMIGLGLVAMMAILTYSLRASFDRTLDEVFLVDYRVEATTLAGDPEVMGISREIAPRLAALDIVAVASPERIAFFEYGGIGDAVLGLDAADVGRIYAFSVVAGDLADLRTEGSVAVSDRAADAQGWSVGGTVAAEMSGGRTADLRIVAVIEADLVDVNFLVDNATFDRLDERNHDNRVAVVLAGDADRDAAPGILEEALAPYPTARLLDASGLRDELVGAVNQILGLVAVLLVLSVLVALMGIVNTLALSILERVRELGLLRAIGATRGQVAAMVRYESMVVAVLGGVLGVAIGVLFGWLVVRSLADFGVTEFVVPFGWIAAGVAAAGVAGVLAGIPPARRAAKVDVLRAIASG